MKALVCPGPLVAGGVESASTPATRRRDPIPATRSTMMPGRTERRDMFGIARPLLVELKVIAGTH
jgi:hypothetical protein